MQSNPQFIPAGELVTNPVPVPDLVRVRVYVRGFTVNENVVVLVNELLIPVTVIVLVPIAAIELAVKVNTVEQVGLHDIGENEAVTPVGNPVTEYETASVVPDTKVAIIVFEVELPCVTTIFPEFDNEKSNCIKSN